MLPLHMALMLTCEMTLQCAERKDPAVKTKYSVN